MWLTGDGVNRQVGPGQQGCHLSVVKGWWMFLTPGQVLE